MTGARAAANEQPGPASSENFYHAIVPLRRASARRVRFGRSDACGHDVSGQVGPIRSIEIVFEVHAVGVLEDRAPFESGLVVLWNEPGDSSAVSLLNEVRIVNRSPTATNFFPA